MLGTGDVHVDPTTWSARGTQSTLAPVPWDERPVRNLYDRFQRPRVFRLVRKDRLPCASVCKGLCPYYPAEEVSDGV